MSIIPYEQLLFLQKETAMKIVTAHNRDNHMDPFLKQIQKRLAHGEHKKKYTQQWWNVADDSSKILNYNKSK